MLVKAGLNSNVGDEGGCAPSLPSNEDAIKLVIDAIEKAGYRPGEQVSIALDPASTEFFDGSNYTLAGEGPTLTSAEMVDYGSIGPSGTRSFRWRMDSPKTIWESWKSLTKKIGNEVQLVGDDLFVTNTERLERGIAEAAGNAILVKLNQIGTLTETLEAVEMAQRAGFGVVISHRSGETEDTFIADLAVATNAGRSRRGAVPHGPGHQVQPVVAHRRASGRRRCLSGGVDLQAALLAGRCVIVGFAGHSDYERLMTREIYLVAAMAKCHWNERAETLRYDRGH